MRPSILRSGFFATLALLTFSFCTITAANAQEKQYSENKADSVLKSAARVDPSTLGMSLEIPFGGAPGRTGTSLNSAIRYSSKQWRINYIMAWHSYINYNVWTRPVFSEKSMAGWTSSLDPPRMEHTGRNQPFDSEGNPLSDDPAAQDNETCFIPRIHFHLADGSSIELRKSDTHQCFPVWDPDPDFTGTFYATDGSGMRFDADAGVLHMPDGGRYFVGPQQSHNGKDGRWATQYIDVNGNVLNYSFTNATDPLARTYANPLASGAVVGDQNYSIPGIGGQNLNYTLRWRLLADVLSDPPAGLRYTSNKKCLGPNNYQLVSPYLFVSSYPTHVCADSNLFNPVVLSEVVLPNGRSYQFKYNAFGEIDKIIYPTGGYERFRYAEVRPVGDLNSPYDQANRGVVERWVSAIGDGTDETHWQYGVDFSSNGYRVTMTAPDNTRTERLLHITSSSYFGFDDILAGMTYEERSYNASNQMLRRNLTQWATITPVGGQPRDPHVTKTTNIILDTSGNALAATAISQYDQDLNVISVDKYDFASIDQSTAQTGTIQAIGVGTLLRREEATYLVNDTLIAAGVRQTYRDRNLLRLVTSSRIKNSAGTVAEGQIVYDEQSYMLPSYGSVTGWIDPQTNPRGLPTTTKSWLDPGNTWLETHIHYDRCGNPRKLTDGVGNISEVQYDGFYHYAYPTHTISADPDGGGNVTPFTTTTVYDLSSGVATSTIDANSKMTTFEYAATDALGNSNALQRLTKTTSADGGWTAYGYSDALGNLFVRTKSALDSSRTVDSTTYFDGLGRGWRSVQSEGGTSIYVDTQFDTMGRAWKVSNPYRGGTVQWTTTTFDALGRVTSVTTPDNAVISTSYDGNSVLVSDQTNKKRKSVTDALGRLTRVYEDPTNLNYLTTYKYDVQGNLRKVDQGWQVRFFMYDSLSRLIRVKNPEHGDFTPDADFSALTDSTSGTSNSQWSMAYKHDANGNLVKRKDARNITTTQVYDGLNRSTSVDYSDGTPDTLLQYDLASNGKGRVNQVWQSGNTISATYIDSYDASGRPSVQRQKFQTSGVWSDSYQVSLSYNYAGDVISQTYPSGRTVNYTYDDAGRTASVTGNLGDGVNRTYAAGIAYSEWGGLSREQFGTDIPLYHRQHYTNRGQRFDTRVGTSDDGSWNRGAIVNYYSVTNFGFGNTGTDTSGDLYIQQYYIAHNDQMTAWTVHQQNYAYDQLGRIIWAGEYLNGGTNTGSQHYLYDRWGNRRIDPITWGTGINSKQFTVDTTTNRLGVPTGQSGSMSYDAAGNLITDTYSGAGSRVYDAENRMISAQGINQSNWQYYTYSAAGQRVRRKVDGVETWQIYGIDGELVAEYAANGATASPQKEYGYRNGLLLITSEPGTGGSSSNVTWTNVTSTLQATGNSLKKISGTNNWDSGAVSTQTISGDGYVSFTAGNNTTWRMCGLGNGDSSSSYTDIEYAIYADGSGNLTIYESGNNRGSFGTYSGTDQLKVAVENGVVKYYRNSTLLYTSTVAPTFPLLVDTSLNTVNTNVYQVTDVVLASSPLATINWLVADHLGTPRMIFDKTGSLTSVKRHDYLPFGEELYAGTGGRTTLNGYGGTTIRQKFTGYERDSETGLDFAQARYHASAQGRFTSVDPANAAATIIDPQTWNGYSYVLNNPLNLVDPNGLTGCPAEFSSCDGGDNGDGAPAAVQRGRARYESLLNTGYDTEFGIYRGEVNIEHTPDGGRSHVATLHNPTQAQVDKTIDSMLDVSSRLAQKGGRPPIQGRGSGASNRTWVLTKDSRGRRTWRYRAGGATWANSTGRPSVAAPLPGVKYHRHHIFPQQFRSRFEQSGVNIDRVSVLVPQNLHQKLHPQWNQDWARFFERNPAASSREIYRFGADMIFRYNLHQYPVMPYRGK